jgi:hypothetical protein
MGIFSGHFTDVEVLNEVLECANRVQQLKVQPHVQMTMPREDNGGSGALWKEECTKLDEKFEAELQKIWMPSSDLYQECHDLSESPRFQKMFVILQDRIPIDMADRTVWDEQGRLNYANLLAAMQNFMHEVKAKNGVVLKNNLMQWGGQQIFDKLIKSDEHERAYADALPFVKNHRVSGIFGGGIAILNDKG